MKYNDCERNLAAILHLSADTNLRKFYKLATPKQGITLENFPPKRGEIISHAKDMPQS